MAVAIAHRLPADAGKRTELLAAGARGFELDVQLRHGQVVVSHHLPFLQIPGWLEHDGGRFRWGGGRLLDPTLDETLSSLPREVITTLDPKEQRTTRRRALTRAVIDELRGHGARLVVVTTDDDADLAAYRAAGVSTWRTAGDTAALHRLLARDVLLDAGVAVRHTLLDASTIGRLHALTPWVGAWTVDDVDRARRLADWGADSVTTDNPAVVRALAG